MDALFSQTLAVSVHDSRWGATAPVAPAHFWFIFFHPILSFRLTWDANRLSQYLAARATRLNLFFFRCCCCLFFYHHAVIVEDSPPGRSVCAGHDQPHQQAHQVINICVKYSTFSAVRLVSVSASVCVSLSLELINLTKFRLYAHLFVLEDGWLRCGSFRRFSNIVSLLKGQKSQYFQSTWIKLFAVILSLRCSLKGYNHSNKFHMKTWPMLARGRQPQHNAIVWRSAVV